MTCHHLCNDMLAMARDTHSQSWPSHDTTILQKQTLTGVNGDRADTCAVLTAIWLCSCCWLLRALTASSSSSTPNFPNKTRQFRKQVDQGGGSGFSHMNNIRKKATSVPRRGFGWAKTCCCRHVQTKEDGVQCVVPRRDSLRSLEVSPCRKNKPRMFEGMSGSPHKPHLKFCSWPVPIPQSCISCPAQVTPSTEVLLCGVRLPSRRQQRAACSSQCCIHQQRRPAAFSVSAK